MLIFENITQEEINEANSVKEKYEDYLKTSYWQKLSKLVKLEADMKCRLCNSRIELCSHHRAYTNLANPKKEITDLICLCAYCHSKYHNKEVKIKVLKYDSSAEKKGWKYTKKKKKHKYFRGKGGKKRKRTQSDEDKFAKYKADTLANNLLGI